MTTEQLSPKQVAQLMRDIRKKVWYLSRLTGRMHQKRFRVDDPFVIAAEEALKAMKVLDDETRKIAERVGVTDPFSPFV